MEDSILIFSFNLILILCNVLYMLHATILPEDDP
jgi:hypothetical protein